MSTGFQILAIIAGMVTLTGMVTTGAVYFMRKHTENLQATTKEAIKSATDSNAASIQKLEEYTKDILTKNNQSTEKSIEKLSDDFKVLSVHIGERIDKIHGRLDTSAAELKEYVAREVSQLKAKDLDQDIKIEHAKDKVHSVNEDLLKFRIEVSEKYEKKQQR